MTKKRLSPVRASMLMLVLTIVCLGCSKKIATQPPVPAPPPPPPPPAPTITLTATPSTITSGQSTTLAWQAANATSVTIDPGVGTVQPATSGNRQVSPTSTTTYTARVAGPGGTQTASVSVAVNAPPAPVASAPTPAAPPPAGPTLDQQFAQTMQPILFDYDKADIRSDQVSKLLDQAGWLRQNTAVRFTVEGHADERGSQEYNIALGDERAASVKRYLISQGIAESRISTATYGEERPVCRESSESCWQQNRRAASVRIP